MDALPLPEHPLLREVADRLESGRHVAEVWDARWQLAYLTTDFILAASTTATEVAPALGEPIYSGRTAALRDEWPGGATRSSWLAHIARWLPAIAHDLPDGVDEVGLNLAPELAAVLADATPRRADSLLAGHVEIKFGRRTVPYSVMGARLTDDDDAFVGTAWVGIPGISGATLSLLATGDHRSLNNLLGLVRPARRPGAVLFADLEGSTALARTLPAAEYFRAVRRLMTCIDDEIVSRGGLVGKHAGDGASAFFLAEQHDSESAAARACIDAARAIRERTGEIAERSDLAASEVAVRFGLHWGATLYVGRLLTSGRADVTALGDAVNEAARIEACASGGLALASKDLIERLDPADAATLGVESAAMRFTTLTDLASATDKARRDAPSLAVCEV